MLFKFIQNKLFVFFLFYLHTALSLLLFSFSDCNKTLDTLSSLLFAVYSFNRCMLLLPGPFSFFFFTWYWVLFSFSVYLPGTEYLVIFFFSLFTCYYASFSFSVYLPGTGYHFPFQFIYHLLCIIFLFRLFTPGTGHHIPFQFIYLVLGIIFLFSLFTWCGLSFSFSVSWSFINVSILFQGCYPLSTASHFVDSKLPCLLFPLQFTPSVCITVAFFLFITFLVFEQSLIFHCFFSCSEMSLRIHIFPLPFSGVKTSEDQVVRKVGQEVRSRGQTQEVRRSRGQEVTRSGGILSKYQVLSSQQLVKIRYHLLIAPENKTNLRQAHYSLTENTISISITSSKLLNLK